MYPSVLQAQQPLDPLNLREVEQAKTLFLRDANVQTNLGNNQNRFRIVMVERHEYPKSVALTAERAANVVAYNYTTDVAVSAVVGLGSNAVKNVVATTGAQPSLSPDELTEARELAIGNPAVQARLASAGAAADPESLIVTHLFVKDRAGPRSCAVHRCIVLFFNTTAAALNVTPIVDLSARTVEVP